MKNRVFNAFLLLAMVVMMFTACKKEYPEPPIQDLPIGTVYTIQDILNMESGTVFTEDASVYGIVTADEVSGNLYKAAFMQDRATGAAIELYLDATSGLRIGDSIRVYLKGVTYAMYNNLPQLSDFGPDGHIVILANNKPIQPAVTTIANVVAGQHLAGLIKLENVKFTDQNTFADPTTYGNRTLIDPSNPTSSVIVRTSNYANFANDSLPQGTGNLVAIASVYGTTWQLLIRSARELEFDGYVPGGDNGLPYYQDFALSFGTYTTYSVAGDQKWKTDYGTATMTGHVNNANYANEDWLISAPVALTGVDHVKVAVNYVAQYQNSNTEDVTLQISKDYVKGTDPLTANWIQMQVTYPNTGGWSDFQTVETSLDDFLGETVTVAIKFLSSETQSRTFEVKFILVAEGVPGGGPTPPTPGTGGQLQTMPYTQSFTKEFGTYMTYDVMGPQFWRIDFNTAKMTGYSGGSHANEDWLISSPVAVTGVSEAKVSVTYSAQYQNADATDVSLQVSTDYVYGTDPTAATWTNMQTTYPNTSSFDDFQTVETSLNNFIGQNVFVAIKYTSTDAQSRTIEIQSITVQEGSGVTPPEPPTPGEVEGDGSRENPYTANDVIALGIETSDGNKYWVKDYLVGVIDGSYNYVFSSSTDVKTNIIISSNLSASGETECIPVQLPVGAVRTGLNLADNPGNFQQEVLLYGTLERYFQKAGVKNVTYAEINGNSYGTDPGATPTPPGPGIEYFNQTLTSQASFNTFYGYSVAGEQEWYFNTAHPDYGAVMSGFATNVTYANEDWFISPVIDLSNSTNPVLNFDHARGPENSINVGVNDGYYAVFVTNEYNNGENPNDERWVELTILNQPTVKWQFVAAGDLVIPAEFKTSTCRIAFRYICPDGGSGDSATWEIKNVVVKEQ
ncbi:MAG: choice-of-anchor J domain-containing protein [Bacteroidales bacterium]|nr:choice-of-anchor J domain-containing protein [Bacteroidales bacterium]